MNDKSISSKEQLLKSIEAIFVEKIISFATAEAYPKTIKEAFNDLFYPDSIFIDIMGLGIYNGDLNQATNFVYDKYKHQHEYSDECFNFYKFRVEETQTLYPNLIQIFSIFYRLTMQSDDYEGIYKQINNELSLLNKK